MPEGPAHIGGGLIGVLLIHKSCDADLQAMDNFRVQKRVDSRLVQGDKPGIVKGNEFLQKASLVRTVAKCPGQILYNNAVDPATLHVRNHALKILPFHVCRAAGAVIYICVCDFIGSIAKKSWNFIAEYLILIHHRFGNNIAVLP